MIVFAILFGFVGFLVSLFGIVWQGFDRDGNAQPALVRWICGAAFFFALFVWALPRLPAPR
jgi:hypothetical protein